MYRSIYNASVVSCMIVFLLRTRIAKTMYRTYDLKEHPEDYLKI